MQRFFLSPDCFQDHQVLFPEDISHQIAHVLRMKPEQEVMALDNAGFIYLVTLEQVSSKRVTGTIVWKQVAKGETKIRVRLMLCLTQREKFEGMLQKCTEIGAVEFVPVISSRSLVQSSRHILNKVPRWQRIIREAAEQSHRGRVPALAPVLKFDHAIQIAKEEPSLRLIPHVGERSMGLRQALQKLDQEVQQDTITVLVGPEGGFTDEEIGQAEKAGFFPITLGPRVLRMETAAMVSTALILYELGEMG